jgi:hypothetical protein
LADARSRIELDPAQAFKRQAAMTVENKNGTFGCRFLIFNYQKGR